MLQSSYPRGESSRARAACDAYLAQGPQRSLPTLRPTLAAPPPSIDTLKGWSAAFGWGARAAAYDAEQRALERAAWEARVAEERERRHTQRLADLDALRPIADEAREILRAISLLKDPKDLLKFYEFIHRGERLELGEATSRTEMTLHEMSDDQLAAEAAARGIRVLRRVGA